MFPGQELLHILDHLRTSLKPDESILPLRALKYRLDNSGVQRTNGLLASLGNDCSYYRKSLDIFLKKDFDDILKILKAIPDSSEDIKSAIKIMESI